MKTRAAILVETGRPLVIDEVGLAPLRHGQVLVEIHATRICGSQIGEIEGVKGPDRFLPHLLGHEAGAVVLETGPGVTQVRAGDRVVCHWRPGRGIDAGGSVHHWNGRSVNAGPITTFQHHAVLSENRVTAVPADTDFELCCLLADTLTTGFGVIRNEARMRAGESVVVFGVGGIGLGVVLAAKLAGAHPVVGVDVHAHKLDVAMRHGLTHAVDATAGPVEEAVRRIVGQGADVTIDLTGSPRVIENAYELTRLRGGRCILVGVVPHDMRISIHPLALHFGRTLTGSEGGSSRPGEDIPKLLDDLRAGVFQTKDFVSHRGPLEAINTMIATMRSGESLHSIITPAAPHP